MNNSIEIIGIDHGWSQMKTSNYCFNTSIKELPNVPSLPQAHAPRAILGKFVIIKSSGSINYLLSSCITH